MSEPKRKDETDLQWRMRVSQDEIGRRDREGPILTPEAELTGGYGDEFVMHIETQTLAYTKRHRGLSSLVRMHRNGQIDDDQFVASQTIARIAEQIARGVSVRGASLEARVDNSRGASDVLIETLQAVRDEVAYGRWRNRLPMPRRMVLDMLTLNSSLAAIARKHRMDWPKGRERLIRSLDLFIEIREKVRDEIGEDELSTAHEKLRLTGAYEKRK